MTAPTDPLTRARALLEKATPGPWQVVREDAGGGLEIGTRNGIPIEWIRVSAPLVLTRYGSRSVTPAQRDADAALIAAAPALLAALCDELEKAREVVEAARGTLDPYEHPDDLRYATDRTVAHALARYDAARRGEAG